MPTYKNYVFYIWYNAFMGGNGMENNINNKCSRDKKGQICIKCKFDDFMNIAEILLKDYGFKIEVIPTDTWPIVIDFDKRVAFTINSATISYLTQKNQGGFLTYDECMEIIKNDD
jgi:hypothetical protein